MISLETAKEIVATHEVIGNLRQRIQSLDNAEKNATKLNLQFSSNTMHMDLSRQIYGPVKNDQLALLILTKLKEDARAKMREKGRRLAQLSSPVPEDCK